MNQQPATDPQPALPILSGIIKKYKVLLQEILLIISSHTSVLVNKMLVYTSSAQNYPVSLHCYL